jgi:hypothetical protein
MNQKNHPDSEKEPFGTNDNSTMSDDRKRRLSFNANNSQEIENSISKELELFHSDAPKNKEEVN